MEAAETALRAGYWLDRYELLGPIAAGGMAKVWLARMRGKRGFEKLFAIKTIRAELVEDADFQEMFLDEARIASGIQHPNVAQILDLGEQGDVLFLVMEWVDGDSLGKIRKTVAKRGGAMPIGIILRVMADACAGLHAAHELRDADGRSLSIVHRDVSPQNILVSTSGAVKVIDFGIAKALNRRQGETRTGVVKGKPQYMAPEQVKRGRGVDRRTDVWALGACLHELLTGRVPYDVEDDLEVIGKLMTGEAPALPEGLPEPIGRVFARSLAVDPDQRFPTAAIMQRAIEAALQELGEATTGEDVAEFMRAECAELASTRRSLVNKAIEEADGRVAAVEDREAPFALTVPGNTPASRRQRTSDIGTAAHLRPVEADSRRFPATHAAVQLDQEPLIIPKRSLAWVWAVLVLGFAGVGGTLYPPSRNALLALASRASFSRPAPLPASPPAPAPATASASVPVPAAPPASASASASASPSVSASATVPASASAPGAASAPASASASPSPSASASSHPRGVGPRRYHASGEEAPAVAPTKPYSIYAPGTKPPDPENPY